MDAEVKTASCVGALHARPALADALPLEWMPSDRMMIRVKEFTCARCQRVGYEYGTVGGAHRIRRTDSRTHRVHDTPAVPHRQAEEWWQALLNGRAI